MNPITITKKKLKTNIFFKRSVSVKKTTHSVKKLWKSIGTFGQYQYANILHKKCLKRISDTFSGHIRISKFWTKTSLTFSVKSIGFIINFGCFQLIYCHRKRNVHFVFYVTAESWRKKSHYFFNSWHLPCFLFHPREDRLVARYFSISSFWISQFIRSNVYALTKRSHIFNFITYDISLELVRLKSGVLYKIYLLFLFFGIVVKSVYNYRR